jgi:hypothetical protein
MVIVILKGELFLLWLGALMRLLQLFASMCNAYLKAQVCKYT